jgi:hypothetical protein
MDKVNPEGDADKAPPVSKKAKEDIPDDPVLARKKRKKAIKLSEVTAEDMERIPYDEEDLLEFPVLVSMKKNKFVEDMITAKDINTPHLVAIFEGNEEEAL